MWFSFALRVSIIKYTDNYLAHTSCRVHFYHMDTPLKARPLYAPATSSPTLTIMADSLGSIALSFQTITMSLAKPPCCKIFDWNRSRHCCLKFICGAREVHEESCCFRKLYFTQMSIAAIVVGACMCVSFTGALVRAISFDKTIIYSGDVSSKFTWLQARSACQSLKASLVNLGSIRAREEVRLRRLIGRYLGTYRNKTEAWTSTCGTGRPTCRAWTFEKFPQQLILKKLITENTRSHLLVCEQGMVNRYKTHNQF